LSYWGIFMDILIEALPPVKPGARFRSARRRRRTRRRPPYRERRAQRGNERPSYLPSER